MILTPTTVPETVSPNPFADRRPRHCRVTIVEGRYYANNEIARSERVRVNSGRGAM